MAAPVPHVPVLFLKQGGSAFFSVRCQKAILDLGWHPDEFGTYEATLKYIRNCRLKVKKDASKCTKRERELGEAYYNEDGTVNPNAYTSGHLFFNSTMQRERGSDCDNYVAGYSMKNCPAMPHQGQTTDGGTQHNRHTVREYADALGPKGAHEAGGPYGGIDDGPEESLKRAKRDAANRARQLVRERREQLALQKSQPQGVGTDTDGGAAAESDDAADASKATAGSPKEPIAPKEHQVDAGSAEECLAAYTALAFNGMQQQCKADVERNKKAAGGLEQPTEAELQAAKSDLKASEARVRELKKGVAEGTATAAEVKAARDEAQACRQHLRRLEAACRAAQGQALEDGTPSPPPANRGPRQPGNAGEHVPGTPASGVPIDGGSDDES